MFWKRNETKSDPSRISVSGAVSVYSWGLCSNSNSNSPSPSEEPAESPAECPTPAGSGERPQVVNKYQGARRSSVVSFRSSVQNSSTPKCLPIKQSSMIVTFYK